MRIKQINNIRIDVEPSGKYRCHTTSPQGPITLEEFTTLAAAEAFCEKTTDYVKRQPKAKS